MPDWKPDDEERKWVELVLSMSADVLMGKGPTKGAYINNLKIIITGLGGKLQPSE